MGDQLIMASKPKAATSHAPKAPAPPPAPARSTPTHPPAPVQPITIIGQRGRFNFVLEKGVTIPPAAVAPRAAGPADLPFKEWFGSIVDGDPVFIPLAFWLAPRSEGGRGVPLEKATASWIKTKIRTTFNNWRDQNPDRENLELIMFERKRGDQRGDDGTQYDEPGMSVWVRTGEPKAAKPGTTAPASTPTPPPPSPGDDSDNE